MQIVYSRSSTATQSLLRQRHILTEARLLVRTEGVAEGFRPAPGVLLFEDPATTSKIPALERPAFAQVAAAANPGDTLTVSELFRLCRDLVDIHRVRAWCLARGVALRVLSGPLSNFADLAAKDATTDLLINVITAVGQFQRDLQNELTDEGIAAAEAQGRYRGRPPALTGDQRAQVRAAYRDRGLSIAALAREHAVSRVAVRTALNGLLPEVGPPPEQAEAAQTPAAPAGLGEMDNERAPAPVLAAVVDPVPSPARSPARAVPVPDPPQDQAVQEDQAAAPARPLRHTAVTGLGPGGR